MFQEYPKDRRYLVSEEGEVFSKKKNRLLKHDLHNYKQYSIL